MTLKTLLKRKDTIEVNGALLSITTRGGKCCVEVHTPGTHIIKRGEDGGVIKEWSGDSR